jgi:hypothetical protein
VDFSALMNVRENDAKKRLTIIEININQSLFSQFLLEPLLSIVEDGMTTQFLQLFDFGSGS